MKRPIAILIVCGMTLSIAPPAHPQSEEEGFSYGANISWINWMVNDTSGIVFNEDFASGYLYGSNVGWIHLGDGSPVNGTSYGNTTADDYGINVDAESDPDFYILRGYAYGANIGWINFDVEQQAGFENQPRIDKSSGILKGSAWSANAGWLPLESEGIVVVRIDFLAEITAELLQMYLLSQTGLTPDELQAADINQDGDVNIADLIALLGESNSSP